MTNTSTKEVLTTKNPTGFAFGIALPLAMLAATVCGWALLTRQFGMKVAFWSWFACFVCTYGVLVAVLNTRRFVFNDATRRIEVTDYWLVVFKGRHTEYAYDDVREIRMRTIEMSNVVITLNSGKKLNPKTGRPAVVRKLCVQIADVMGKSAVFPGRWA